MANKLTVNPDNPRTISKEAFEQLKAKILRNPDGLTANKIVHKDGIIIAGNQRFRAITELKLEQNPEWFKDVSGWTPEQIREYLVTSNISDGDWNWDTLLNEYEPIELNDWGLEVPDWNDDKEVEEDEAPEVSSEPPVSVLGEIYQLGRHRVMCGDSKTDKSKLLDTEIDMVLTDPPYNIGYADMKGKFDSIANDKMSDEDFVEFLKDTLNVEADTFYVCCSWQYSHLFRQAMEEIGKPVKAFIVWNKVNPAQNLDKYFKAHEIILYNGKFGGQKTLRSDVWEVKREKNTDHPTMKPIELLSYALVDTPEAKIVYDPFLGSGSTLIACEQTDRTCYGMELDPKYVDVIRKRYAKFTNNNELPDNWEELTPAIDGV